MDRRGRLPLHYAAEGGHLACVTALAQAMRQQQPLPGGEAGGCSLEVEVSWGREGFGDMGGGVVWVGVGGWGWCVWGGGSGIE